MRKFTSDYIYGVIDTYIVTCEIKPKIDYGFLVQTYDEFGYAVITFTYYISDEEKKDHWFRFVKNEPMVKLLKNVYETLELICKNEK